MARNIYHRALLQACYSLGGEDVLAAKLDKPLAEVLDYLVGSKPIPVPVFAQAVDILIEAQPKHTAYVDRFIEEIQRRNVCSEASAGIAVKDISESKRAEEVMRESEAKFRTVFETMIEACCIFELIYDDLGKPVDWRILEANPGYERQSGLKDVAGKLASEVMPGTEPYWIEAFGRVAETGEAEQIEKWHQPTGRWIHSSTARLGGSGSRRLVSVFYDITERKRAEISLRESEASLRKSEQALKEVDRHKDDFLAMLSHELRTPLAALTSAAQVLRRSAPDHQDFVGARRIMERQTQHIARLMEELLDITRVRLGKLLLKLEPLNLAEIVVEVTDTKRAAHAFDGRAAVNVAVSPVWVQGDRARLEQIYSNLLDNALKFTPPSGAIDVDVRRDGNEAVLRVADNGQGIDAAILPTVFDLFVQAEQGRERTQGGLGLGLALVQRLADLHGGHVEAASDGLGHGATFTVGLPAIDESS